MSLMTILATFALARPKNESAPVWSVITPTLMDRPTEVVDSFMAFSQPSDGKVHESPIDCIRQDTAMVTRGFFVLLFYTGFGVLTLMLPIIRDLPHIDPQKIGNPVLWLAVALAVTFLIINRKWGTRFTSACLWAMIGSLVLLLLGGGVWLWGLTPRDFSPGDTARFFGGRHGCPGATDIAGGPARLVAIYRAHMGGNSSAWDAYSARATSPFPTSWRPERSATMSGPRSPRVLGLPPHHGTSLWPGRWASRRRSSCCGCSPTSTN
jgi:hypothetical protein